MCGIFCSLSGTQHVLPDDEIETRLRSRGPDSTGTVNTTCISNGGQGDGTCADKIYITMVSTVLSLRGSFTICQPYQDEHEQFTLCWNGEAWSIDHKPTHGNDTEAVHELLSNAMEVSSNDEGAFESATTVAYALSQIAGPYAFVGVDHVRQRLYFGRDFLGRRSLLKKITNQGDLMISSVSDGSSAPGWTEIEADGIYCINLNSPDAIDNRPGYSHLRWGGFNIAVAPYAYMDNPLMHSSVIPRLTLNRNLPSSQMVLTENSPPVHQLESLLRKSLSMRILTIPDIQSSSEQIHDSNCQAKIAVLFSGGLDCSLLARLSHDILPLSEPIDLLNVAFENPRLQKNIDGNDPSKRTAYELCPDRITAHASYMELQQICPGRVWRLVTINVPYSETIEYREKIISLMHPHNTEMDLSIANALYFAARGQGMVSKSMDGEPYPYTTPARVLLSGLGADELFAGYTRHATAFKRNAIEGLLDELELDVSRLGKRNLGRDDRVMSHWSKEVRFPFLDEKLLSWALNVPVNEKCGFGEPVQDPSMQLVGGGSGELELGKKVLRCLAWKLGMKQVAKEKKRAIQFGARTAKMETGKTKGTQLVS